MTNVSDYTFYGGGGFGGINKAQEAKTVYVPMADPLPNKLPSNMLRSVVARVYKAGKRRTHKKKKTVNSSAKKPRRVSKKPKRQTKVKKVKKVSNKKLTFQNF